MWYMRHTVHMRKTQQLVTFLGQIGANLKNHWLFRIRTARADRNSNFVQVFFDDLRCDSCDFMMRDAKILEKPNGF